MATNALPARRLANARAFIAGGLGKHKAWSDVHYAYDYQEDGMLFLHWFEDDPKKNVAARLAGACGAYRERFGVDANVILVSEQDAGAALPGCEVRVERRIGPNNYQVGRTE
jgi:hypothetical protein